MRDMIGLYREQDGDIVFEPTEHFTYFSDHGFMKLVPFIRVRLHERASPHALPARTAGITRILERHELAELSMQAPLAR